MNALIVKVQTYAKAVLAMTGSIVTALSASGIVLPEPWNLIVAGATAVLTGLVTAQIPNLDK